MTAAALAEITRPSPEVAAEAGTAARSLAALAPKRKAVAKHVTIVANDAKPVVVPREAFDLFIRVLTEMANGNAVTIVPVHAELTTQQAAELLNVSRPYLVQLLDEKKIPCRMVGTRRRIRFEDLVRYKQQDDAERTKVADELAAEAQRLGIEY